VDKLSSDVIFSQNFSYFLTELSKKWKGRHFIAPQCISDWNWSSWYDIGS